LDRVHAVAGHHRDLRPASSWTTLVAVGTCRAGWLGGGNAGVARGHVSGRSVRSGYWVSRERPLGRLLPSLRVPGSGGRGVSARRRARHSRANATMVSTTQVKPSSARSEP
jgi:hypothetical protein